MTTGSIPVVSPVEAERSEHNAQPRRIGAHRPQARARDAAAGSAPRRLVRRILGLPRLWARSLLFRAVSFTGLLTMLGTVIVAAFLTQQITTGLFQERFDQVEAEATNSMDEVVNEIAAAPAANRIEARQVVSDAERQMQGTGAQVERYYILAPLEEAEDPWIQPRASQGVEDFGIHEQVTEDLAETVAAGTGQYWQSIGFEREGETVPGIVFGTQLELPPGDAWALYYVYDFSSVQETLDFVLRILFLAAVAILLMNMAIAAWVARSVVHPVSQAAEVSERIADGQLDQRLAVRGEDEIARLGLSFNRMASHLQEQITQLANLSKMQQRFVSDVSHELRTPLTTVQMAAAVLHESREDFDPINQRSAELLHHQVERFQALLADLLEMSRFDAGAAELTLTDTDLRGVAEEVLRSAQPLAESSNSPLSLVVQGEDFLAEVDPRRIDRILRNLVNNAIEHSEARPVDVVIASSPTAIGIAVRDHGIGMSPAEVSHVFDRFWRADPARARSTGGSGLGLSIATEDTRLHQGALDAWGQTGQGACFRLVLPRRQAEPYRASPVALPPIYRASDRHRVVQPGPETPTTREIDHDRVAEQALHRPSRDRPPQDQAPQDHTPEDRPPEEEW